jgi:hypothetical protein
MTRDWTDYAGMAAIAAFATFIVVVIIAAILNAINTPNNGYVYDREYYASYTSISCGKTGCSSTFIPERHYLCIENKGQDKKGCKLVSTGDYDKYQVGEWYPG